MAQRIQIDVSDTMRFETYDTCAYAVGCNKNVRTCDELLNRQGPLNPSKIYSKKVNAQLAHLSGWRNATVLFSRTADDWGTTESADR